MWQIINSILLFLHLSKMRNFCLAKVRKIVNKIRIVDSHEHLPPEENRIRTHVDSLNFFLDSGAQLDDLSTAGMSKETLTIICNRNIPFKERWHHFEPYLEKIRNTGYTKAFKIAVHDIYGIQELNSKSFINLNEKIKVLMKKGLYRWVLQDKAKIDYVVNQGQLLQAPETALEGPVENYIFPLALFDNLVMIKNPTDLEYIHQQTGMKIQSLQDLINAITKYFNTIQAKIVGLKFSLAYQRSLHFEHPSLEEAEEGFKEVMQTEPLKTKSRKHILLLNSGQSSSENDKYEIKMLQDFLMNHILELSGESGLPVQFHSGLLGGIGQILTHSNPILMNKLFIQHKKTKFIILHCFPYCDESGALAKMFPNVFIDMTWLNVISPKSAQLALSKWIDLLPINKIIAFGGDERRVEVSYGNSVIARETIARVLWEKVVSGDLLSKRVSLIAQKLLRENAYELYFSKRINF